MFSFRYTLFAYAKNKDADQLIFNHQLRVNGEADQRLCFRYTGSTIPLLPTFQISSLLSSSVVYSPVCVGLVGNPKDRFSRDAAQLK